MHIDRKRPRRSGHISADSVSTHEIGDPDTFVLVRIVLLAKIYLYEPAQEKRDGGFGLSFYYLEGLVAWLAV